LFLFLKLALLFRPFFFLYGTARVLDTFLGEDILNLLLWLGVWIPSELHPIFVSRQCEIYSWGFVKCKLMFSTLWTAEFCLTEVSDMLGPLLSLFCSSMLLKLFTLTERLLNGLLADFLALMPALKFYGLNLSISLERNFDLSPCLLELSSSSLTSDLIVLVFMKNDAALLTRLFKLNYFLFVGLAL
jgi:hypothetical protein